MTPLSLLRRPATFAYGAVRTPLALIESRLPDSSRLRAGLGTALRGADAWLDGEAPRIDPQPRNSAQVAPEPAHDAAADPWQDGEAVREAIVDDVRERQPDVGELADPDLDVAEVQAQLRAKHAVAEHESAESTHSTETAATDSGPVTGTP